MASTPPSGSRTSPVPEMRKRPSLSATAMSASSLLRTRSVLQSLASSTAARDRFPWCWSSFFSNRSKRVNASAVDPANPASTFPWYSVRTFLAVCLITVSPMVTWPSPPMATLPSSLTASTVVPFMILLPFSPTSGETCHRPPGACRG